MDAPPDRISTHDGVANRDEVMGDMSCFLVF